MFKTIVFAYDGSSCCRDAFEEGIELAARLGARCHLLAVIPPPPTLALAEGPLPPEAAEAEQAAVTAVLKEGVARMGAAGIEAHGHIRSGDSPAIAIGDFAREVAADLVIVGHHRRSAIQRWWYGSVGHSLLDHLPCSVLVSMPRK